MAVQRLAKQGAEGAREPLLDKETGPHEVVHPAPLRWFTHNWRLGRNFFDSAKFGIVQYVSVPKLLKVFKFFVDMYKFWKRLEREAGWTLLNFCSMTITW